MHCRDGEGRFSRRLATMKCASAAELHMSCALQLDSETWDARSDVHIETHLGQAPGRSRHGRQRDAGRG